MAAETKRVVFVGDGFEAIDRESFEPVYAQLVNILRQQVAQGVLRPGDQLPSEAQLCRRYQISPMTVRRAVNILVDEGLVVAERGRGTFIRSVELGTASFHLQRLQELFDDEVHTTVKLIKARIVVADEHAAGKLQVPSGRRVIYLRRLILTRDEPTLCHTEYLVYDPARPVVEAEMNVTSLRGLFGGAGTTLLKRGDLRVEATLLDEAVAALLQVNLPAAAFRIEHLFYDFDDRPVSWGWFLGHGDRLSFTSHLGVRAAS